MDDVTLWVFFDPGPDSLPFACDAKSPSRFRPVRRLARLGSDRATYDGVFVGGVPNDAPSCHDSAGVIAPPRRDISSAGRAAAGGACARARGATTNDTLALKSATVLAKKMLTRRGFLGCPTALGVPTFPAPAVAAPHGWREPRTC